MRVAGHLRGNIHIVPLHRVRSRRERQERGRLDMLCKDISKSDRVAPLLSRSVWAGDWLSTSKPGYRLRTADVTGRSASGHSTGGRMRNGEGGLQMAKATASFEMQETKRLGPTFLPRSLCATCHPPAFTQTRQKSPFPLPRHFFSFRSK